MIGIGPKEKWQHDLDKLSRAALVEIVLEMQFRIHLTRGPFDQEAMGKLIENCKKYGKWRNQDARRARFAADPDKFIDQTIRRSKAAKKAARRRKRARKA